MATLTKTVTNTLNVFGPSPTNKWGIFTWGQNWAYGNIDLITSFNKLIANSIVPDSGIGNFSIFLRSVTNTITLSEDMTFEGLIDPNGYNHFFGSSTNAENRPNTSYNELSDFDATYSEVPESSTSWTKL